MRLVSFKRKDGTVSYGTTDGEQVFDAGATLGSKYPDLRSVLAAGDLAALEGKGYTFSSSGDTEVILKAYHAWGPRCVEKFHGMFAFAIHERDSGRVVLARDRFGIKPFYYTEDGKRLRFASSLQAILAAGDVDTSIDPVGLNHYMSFHAVVPPPRTILNGVKKLRELSPLYDMHNEGIDITKIEWAAH